MKLNFIKNEISLICITKKLFYTNISKVVSLFTVFNILVISFSQSSYMPKWSKWIILTYGVFHILMEIIMILMKNEKSNLIFFIILIYIIILSTELRSDIQLDNVSENVIDSSKTVQVKVGNHASYKTFYEKV